MVLNFTVANLSIYNKWLLTTSHLPCPHGEKACSSSEQEKAAVQGFWKLFPAAVHVNTVLPFKFYRSC